MCIIVRYLSWTWEGNDHKLISEGYIPLFWDIRAAKFALRYYAATFFFCDMILWSFFWDTVLWISEIQYSEGFWDKILRNLFWDMRCCDTNFLLRYLHYGAESFNWARNISQFMWPEDLLLYSQVPASSVYPEPHQFNPCPHIPIPEDILGINATKFPSLYPHSYRAAATWYYQSSIYSPTDAPVSCLKKTILKFTLK